MAALGRGDEGCEGLTAVAKEQPFALHGSDGRSKADPVGGVGAPGPQGQNDGSAGDVAAGVAYVGHAHAVQPEPGDAAEQHLAALLLRRLGQGEVEAVAVELGGLGFVGGAADLGAQPRLDAAHFAAVDPMQRQILSLPGHGLPNEGLLFLVQRQPKLGAALVEEVNAGLLPEPGGEIGEHAVPQEAQVEGRAGAELGAEHIQGAGGVGRCPAADGVEFQQDDAGAPGAELIGDGAADDSGAYDRYVRGAAHGASWVEQAPSSPATQEVSMTAARTCLCESIAAGHS